MNIPKCRSALLGLCVLMWPVACIAGAPANFLYPDMFPYVEEDAEGRFETLQNWQISGDNLIFNTLFANQGDGVFEIRAGDDIPDTERYELLQRVYIDNDYPGSNFVDIPIGDAPKPLSSEVSGAPIGNPSNVIWFENFTHFSLHEASMVDGLVTVGDEVAGTTKMSWRLSPNTGPLPGYEGLPANGSSNQTLQQRIGVGWADLYTAGSFGQSIDITRVTPGPLYWLRQTVDPANRITETDETNNSVELLIDLNNPGQALRTGGQFGSFLKPGDPTPITPGDLTGDSKVTIDDWIAFKAGNETSLEGLSEADAYALGDLNLDGRHSLADAALFRQYYDAVNGAGAFAAIQSVPEPTSVLMFGVSAAVVCYVGRRQLYRARQMFMVGISITTFLVVSSPRIALGDITSLKIDTDTGEMTILNAEALTGYEVTGPSGSLDEETWLAENLDARNVGSDITTDFNGDHVVNLADYTKWRDSLGGPEADADGDGQTESDDYELWKQQFGSQIAEGTSWETLAASDMLLREFLLEGETNDSALSLGRGYDAQTDLRNLQFFYSTPDDLEIEGIVTYTGGLLEIGALPVPEPGGLWLVITALVTTVGGWRWLRQYQ